MEQERLIPPDYSDFLVNGIQGPSPYRLSEEIANYEDVLERGEATIADTYLLRNTIVFGAFIERLKSYSLEERLPKDLHRAMTEGLAQENMRFYQTAQNNAGIMRKLAEQEIGIESVLTMVANSGLNRQRSALYSRYAPTELELLSRNALQSSWLSMYYDFMGPRRNTRLEKATPKESTHAQTMINSAASSVTLNSIIDILAQRKPDQAAFIESHRGFANEIEVSAAHLEVALRETDCCENDSFSDWYFPSAFVEDVEGARIDGYFIKILKNKNHGSGLVLSPIDIKLSKGKPEPTQVETSLGSMALRVNAKTIGNIDENGSVVCGLAATKVTGMHDQMALNAALAMEPLDLDFNMMAIPFFPRDIDDIYALGLASAGINLPESLLDMTAQEIEDYTLNRQAEPLF